MPSAGAGVNTDASASAGWDSHERSPRWLTGPLLALSPAGYGRGAPGFRRTAAARLRTLRRSRG